MARKKTFTQEELYQATHDLMLLQSYLSYQLEKMQKWGLSQVQPLGKVVLGTYD